MRPAAAMSLTECYSLARQIRLGERWPTVRGFLRPRGLSLFRSRPPLTILLYYASRNGCLLRDEQLGSLIILNRPKSTRRRPWLDRSWDVLVLLGPAVAFFALAAIAVAITAPPWLQISLVLAVTFWPALFWTAGMMLGAVSFVRSFFRWPTGRIEMVYVDAVLDANWSIELFHLVGDDVTGILTALEGKDPLVIPADAVTTTRALECLKASSQVDPLGDESSSLLVLAQRPGMELQVHQPKISPHAVMVLGTLTGIAFIIAAGAKSVASMESSACDGGSCDGRPATYWNAVYWLLNRLSGGDPNGLGAETAWGRAVGLIVTGASLFFVAVLVKVLTDRFLDLRGPSAIEAAAEFNEDAGASEAAVSLLVGDGNAIDAPRQLSPRGTELLEDPPTADGTSPSSPPFGTSVALRPIGSSASRSPTRPALAFAAGASTAALAVAAFWFRKRLRSPKQ
ncbi:hypothetical protein ACLQ28_20110 [Micromonospora sp. DT201]|uniref:hypothetical protein n=1 Tax=Micromonospora sp. DT201 TaxID=3393442 RepID=UPI003CF5DB11